MIDQLKELLKYGSHTRDLKIVKPKSGLYRFIYDHGFRETSVFTDKIICIIDDRCVRLNKAHRLYKELEPVLHDFAEKHSRAFKIITLNESRAMNMYASGMNANANWTAEKRENVVIEPSPMGGLDIIVGDYDGTAIDG